MARPEVTGKKTGHLGENSIAWFEDEIDDFLEVKAAARDQRKTTEYIHSE
jgi:hypothetical protein